LLRDKKYGVIVSQYRHPNGSISINICILDNNLMKIWVDADACPGAIKEIIVRAALRLEVPTVFVANKLIDLPATPFLAAIQVAKGSDVADAYIAERAEVNDLVITQDIPLAALLVPKGVAVISPRGDLHTPDNIRQALSIRNFMDELRGTGTITGGPRPFDDKIKQQFANTFNQVLTKLLKS
jgi:uncharacterized protein